MCGHLVESLGSFGALACSSLVGDTVVGSDSGDSYSGAIGEDPSCECGDDTDSWATSSCVSGPGCVDSAAIVFKNRSDADITVDADEAGYVYSVCIGCCSWAVIKHAI